jgi:hypothetical protein
VLSPDPTEVVAGETSSIASDKANKEAAPANSGSKPPSMAERLQKMLK